MSDKHESMNGIIRLYELRREPVMRAARDWMAAFYAGSVEDIADVFNGNGDVYFRMVLTYWDMAAAFVNHGAIDEQLFNEINVEHLAVFAKVEPFIGELREMAKNPRLLANLETLVRRVPEADAAMAHFRERAKESRAAQTAAVSA